MAWGKSNLLILVAEDDENDAYMLKRAFEKNGIDMPVHFCGDGEEVMAYLKAEGKYADRIKFPFPRAIITDLKMPRCTGFEILSWLQEHPECNLIPKIVLTASNQTSDVVKAYQLGANCYFTKPSRIADLCNIVDLVYKFWSAAEIPPLPENC